MDQFTADVARFFDLVSGIQIRSRRTVESGLRARDLTYAQFSALIALSEHDGMSQAELAQALDTDSTTAMVLRTSLEKKRLVARKDDPQDGRVKRIIITEGGKSALQGAMPEAKALYSKASALLTEADLKRMLPVLERLHGFLGELNAPKKGEEEAVGRKGKAKPAAKKAAKPAKAPAKRGVKAAKPAAKAKVAQKAKVAAKTKAAKAPSAAKPAARKAK